MAEQHERLKVRRPCIEYLRTIEPTLKYDLFYWTCPPDMGKLRPWVANQYKLDGYQKGVFDLTIITCLNGEVKAYLVEFKWGYNGYTDEQKVVAEACKETPVIAVKIKSLDEFKEFCEVYLT